MDDALARQQLDVAMRWADAAPEVLGHLRAIVQAAADVYLASKELDAAVEHFRIARGASIAKLREIRPMLERQLDRLSDRVDRVLDQAQRIDVRGASQEDVQLRSQLLQTAQAFSAQLSTLLVEILRS